MALTRLRLATEKKMRTRRLGVTLVELLIVMGLIVLLAGLTLPTVRSVLKDQRVTEAARVFQGLAEGARAKAVYMGRPVALILERIPTDPSATTAFNLAPDNTVERISMGEVFPPYEGDWWGTTGTIVAAPTPTVFQIPLAQASSLMDVTTGTPTGLVQPYDLIQFGDHAQLFLITGLARAGVAPNYNVTITFQNPPVGYYRPTNPAAYSEPQWTVSGGETRFRIFRQPTKSMVGSVGLPRGTCIDLTNSGVGANGRQFQVNARTTTLPAEFSSVSIIFNSRGTVDGAYYINLGAVVPRVEVMPVGLYHFQIGRPEQVIHSTLLGTPAATPGARDDFKANLYDTSGLWVTINPYSGAVYTTQNFLSDTAPAATQLSVARTLASQALSNGKN